MPVLYIVRVLHTLMLLEQDLKTMVLWVGYSLYVHGFSYFFLLSLGFSLVFPWIFPCSAGTQGFGWSGSAIRCQHHLRHGEGQRGEAFMQLSAVSHSFELLFILKTSSCSSLVFGFGISKTKDGRTLGLLAGHGEDTSLQLDVWRRTVVTRRGPLATKAPSISKPI